MGYAKVIHTLVTCAGTLVCGFQRSKLFSLVQMPVKKSEEGAFRWWPHACPPFWVLHAPPSWGKKEEVGPWTERGTMWTPDLAKMIGLCLISDSGAGPIRWAIEHLVTETSCDGLDYCLGSIYSMSPSLVWVECFTAHRGWAWPCNLLL